MDTLTLCLEISLLSAAFVGLHALSQRLGLAPFYLALGVVWAFVVVSDHLAITVQLPGELEASHGSLTFFGVALVGLVIVYTLDGTLEARRYLAGLVTSNVLLLALQALQALHMARMGPGALDAAAAAAWSWPDATGYLIGSLALLVDGVVIVVVYQTLLNRAPWLPLFAGMAVALVAAMLADGLVFAGLYGGAGVLERLAAESLGRGVAGLAAAVPAGAYLYVSLARFGGREQRLQRGAFDFMQRQLASMREDLERSQARYALVKRTFARYVAPSVVEELLRDPARLELGGEVKTVTMLFSDIRGYSTLSERMPPTEVIDLLNQYFSAMSQIIDDERGAIIEFKGDGILAAFGAPLPVADHAARAVRATARMFEALDDLNARWEASGVARRWRSVGLDAFRIRVGVHTGEVVVGNVGSETRTKYAVVGETVNIAANVEALNKQLDTSALITEATAAALDAPLALRDRGEHPLRSAAGALRVFSLRDLDARQPEGAEGA